MTPPLGTFPKIHLLWYPDQSLKTLRNSTFNYMYQCSLSGHAHCSRSMGEEAHLPNSHSKFTIGFHFSNWDVTKIFLIFKVCTFQIYCFGTCITFLIIIGDQVVLFLKNHPMTIFMNYVSLTAPLRV